MKIFCVFFTLLCIVACAYAAVAIFPYEPKPPQYACREGCYLSSLNRVLPYNKPYYPKGKCLQYTCETNNETQLVSCGAISIGQPNCRIVQDLKKKYPACCGRPVCDPTTAAPTTVDNNSCDK